MSDPPSGKLIVLSGPSGVGKTTLLKALLAKFPSQLRLSVSATTRPPRPDEQPGIDYYFLSPEEFRTRLAAGEFLEACEVFGHGYWYGTLRSEVEPSLAGGKSVVLEIDVAGARAILKQFPDAITIFVLPNSAEQLERRLRNRGTESEESILRRLEAARRELAEASSYRYQIVNDRIDEAVQQISHILTHH